LRSREALEQPHVVQNQVDEHVSICLLQKEAGALG
jgi:hypothetical protein